MSFRLTRGPKIITLLHDAASPSSQKILKLLQSRAMVKGDAEQDTKSAKEFLEKAASKVQSEPIFNLEIIDRRRATSDQWETIASYLNRSSKAVNALRDEQGPFVVNWDDGKVAQTEQEAKEMIDSIEAGTSGNSGKQDAGGCTIV